MKPIFFILKFYITVGFGQQYDGVFIENRRVDKNNTIYTLGKEFVYTFTISNNKTPLYIQKDNITGFKLTPIKDSLTISSIHATVIKPRMFQRTNIKQTEVYYSYEPNPTFTSSTGIVENSKNVWLHPPRDMFFKALQTCPFPYIQLDKPLGHQWQDSMSIGAYWSDTLWGEWEERLLLQYDYTLSGKEMVQTAMGAIECMVVEAIATSAIGRSKLKGYFSKEHGFIQLNYTLVTGMEVELMLTEIKEGPILRDGKDFFKINFNKKKNQTRYFYT